MCECLKMVDAQLAQYNTRVGTALSLSEDMGAMWVDIVVGSEKVDTTKRGRARTIVAAYCPFCGEKRSKSMSNHQNAADPPDGSEQMLDVKAPVLGRGSKGELSSGISG